MLEKIIGTFLIVVFGFIIISIPFILTSEKREKTVEHVMKVCEETGMYLTEGKAMSCRVLKDQRG